MAAVDKSIPVFPSRSLKATIKFYERLGFAGVPLASDTYAILTPGDLEVHFFPHPDLKPEKCFAGCYMRVTEVDTLRTAFEPAGRPSTGIARLERVKNKPWKMREFALIDEDGNLVKFGKAL